MAWRPARLGPVGAHLPACLPSGRPFRGGARMCRRPERTGRCRRLCALKQRAGRSDGRSGARREGAHELRSGDHTGMGPARPAAGLACRLLDRATCTSTCRRHSPSRSTRPRIWSRGRAGCAQRQDQQAGKVQRCDIQPVRARRSALGLRTARQSRQSTHARRHKWGMGLRSGGMQAGTGVGSGRCLTHSTRDAGPMD